MTMLKDTSANMPAIEEMFFEPKRYWVNVGVRKFFTTDLTEATEFYDRVGDSLYSAERGSYAGTEILVSEDGPAMYRVELSFSPLDERHLYACPDGWVSAQHNQGEAERIAENVMNFGSISNVYKESDLKYVESITVSIIRCGAGMFEETTIKLSDMAKYHHAELLGIHRTVDFCNNVGRMCSVFNEFEGRRIFKIECAMIDSVKRDRHYFVRNIETGEGKVVKVNDMTNLY